MIIAHYGHGYNIGRAELLSIKPLVAKTQTWSESDRFYEHAILSRIGVIAVNVIALLSITRALVAMPLLGSTIIYYRLQGITLFLTREYFQLQARLIWKTIVVVVGSGALLLDPSLTSKHYNVYVYQRPAWTKKIMTDETMERIRKYGWVAAVTGCTPICALIFGANVGRSWRQWPMFTALARTIASLTLPVHAVVDNLLCLGEKVLFRTEAAPVYLGGIKIGQALHAAPFTQWPYHESVQGMLSPFTEGALYRTGIQEGLLRRLPKRLLPQRLKHWVDHPVARVFRVLFVAALYGCGAISTSNPYISTVVVVGTPTINGVILGALQERSARPMSRLATVAHMLFNLLGHRPLVEYKWH